MLFGKKKVVKASTERGYVKKLEKLGKNNLDDDSVAKLNDIIKDYLRSKFKISQSSTFEETIKKLDEKKVKSAAKIDLSHLLVQIYQKEYFPHESIPVPEISFLISLAIKTLKEIESGKSIMSRELQAQELPDIEVKGEEKKSVALVKLERDISSLGEKFTIDWRDDKIRKAYEKIRSDYNSLSDDEKSLFYPKIISLFKFKK